MKYPVKTLRQTTENKYGFELPSNHLDSHLLLIKSQKALADSRPRKRPQKPKESAVKTL